MFKSLTITFFSFLFLLGFNTETNDEDLQKKVIRTQDFDIECYVSLKKQSSFNANKMYYWFKSGEIHSSVASAGGFVLHSDYTKYYRSNQLAEKGSFNYGLKNGLWKDWYTNGQLKQIVGWKNGVKNGKFATYDSIGNATQKGAYNNNIKTGAWIDLKTNDTIVYKKGEVFNPETEKESFFKRLFKKKDSTKTKKANPKTQKKKASTKKSSKKKSSSKKATAKQPKKEGFFKRLFKKKDKTTTTRKKS